MPKIIGVLTHLDLIKSPAALKAQKKRLKHRFWTEVYDGAKMFYLSGVLNGRYPDREILNLSRFISIAKFRPLVFRNSHSYFLADRFDDITPQDVLRADPASDRTIAVFGYMRGVPLRAPTDEHPVRVHVPGSGADAFQASRLVELADPCPLPTVESEKRRKLGDKNRVAYAPMSGGAGGGVMWDGERVWISTTGTFSRADDADGGDVQDELEGGCPSSSIDAAHELTLRQQMAVAKASRWLWASKTRPSRWASQSHGVASKSLSTRGTKCWKGRQQYPRVQSMRSETPMTRQVTTATRATLGPQT